MAGDTHISIFKCQEDFIRRTTECGENGLGWYNCFLCLNFRQQYKRQISKHFISSHWKLRVEVRIGDNVVYCLPCHSGCTNKPHTNNKKHYHCPMCKKTVTGRKRFESHAKAQHYRVKKTNMQSLQRQHISGKLCTTLKNTQPRIIHRT